ncbi:long-chain-fatty-acid-CoA ligase [Cantharellus anzutake]|uniref:long-chain-fatty-acid-CoA ligase n=1 Tax=Cantharellus anzutake TaxID=1750568 RepID=UPI0019051156|nr:long-chain-fatty-acid-CoA ligase [Cantharellus anzutake]KAF8332680.1 long-chain-fatty-acid-CoA ligase [Cantharellus anzutake]
MAVRPGDFKPYRSLKECDEILTAPGSMFEIQQTLIRGVMTKVFKNAPKNARLFLLWLANTYADRDFIVFENERWTYAQMLRGASHAAGVFRDVYGVHKGDRVGIVMRNFPEFLISFFACQLLGAVPVLVNAWLSGKTISYCLTHTQCKLIILDSERADRFERHLESTRIEARASGTLVVRAHEGRGSWEGTRNWEAVMKKYAGKGEEKSWLREPECEPEDNGYIFFTSGTTGTPKGVLGSQRALISAAFNPPSIFLRQILRENEPATITPPEKQRATLISVPLFHVTGLCASVMAGALVGGKLVLMRKWDPEIAVDLIVKERITLAGGVPSVAVDLLESEKFRNSEHELESIAYGGASAPPQLPKKLSKLRSPVMNGQGYGLTETAAAIVGVLGQDSFTRPTTAGYPSVVSDILIVDPRTKTSVPIGQAGEVWLKGPTVMTGYWKNSEATKKVLTQDGWFNSEDIGYLDNDGFLYISGRGSRLLLFFEVVEEPSDLFFPLSICSKRHNYSGGENIDVVAVENALYDDERVLQAVVVGVPDSRLGELPVAIVHLKAGRTATEGELIALTKEKCPAFAAPVMVIFVDKPLEANAGGKVPKIGPRALAKEEWARRKAGAKVKANARL